jgi:hypothetical protein
LPCTEPKSPRIYGAIGTAADETAENKIILVLPLLGEVLVPVTEAELPLLVLECIECFCVPGVTPIRLVPNFSTTFAHLALSTAVRAESMKALARPKGLHPKKTRCPDSPGVFLLATQP